MIHANGDEDQGWDRGWSEHKIRQLVRLARMPFSKKLDWLENAHTLAQAIRRSTRVQPPHAPTSESANEGC